MKTDRWVWVLSGLLAGLILTLMVSLKKPLCIDSNDIETIYRVSNRKTERIYKCSSRVKVPYSKYFASNTDKLESRIEPLIAFLKNLGPINKRIKLTITEDQPYLFKVNQNNFMIGTELLKAPGHLERGIIKVWFFERRNNSVGLKNYLFVESVTDFLLAVYSGKLIIQDPIAKIKAKLGEAKWPQVLNSKEGYCESPWRASEHYLVCLQKNLFDQLGEDLVANLSLRPLLTSVLVQSYKELEFNEKIRLMQRFDEYLQTQQLNSEKSIEMVLNEVHPLKKGMMNIKKVSDLVNSSSLMKKEREYREFYGRIALGLQRAGVSDSFAEAYFDYLIEYPIELNTNSKFFNGLVQTAIKNPQVQIALKDKNQIWLLPSKASIPIGSFDMIKSQQYVLMACLDLKTLNIADYFNQSEKLLMVKGCDLNRSIDFNSLVIGGARSFAQKNKKLAFIQFHLPSFEMKAKQLSHIKNFFELVKNRDVNRPEFQVLGWSQVQWSDDFMAYKPKATVDAIEYFRDDGTY